MFHHFPMKLTCSIIFHNFPSLNWHCSILFHHCLPTFCRDLRQETRRRTPTGTRLELERAVEAAGAMGSAVN
jgi:hypothetical protein